MANIGPEWLREYKKLALMLAVALGLGVLVSLAWASPATADHRCSIAAAWSDVVNEGGSGSVKAYAPGCGQVIFSVGPAISEGNGVWSTTFYATNRDGPASQMVNVTGILQYCCGFFGEPLYDYDFASTTVTINNVPPQATFNGPTSSVEAGEDFTLSLTDPSDPSSADVQAGFTYAFDCDGDGTFEQTGTSSTATCTAGDSAQTVKGKISDKDDGSTTYEQTVDVAEHTAPAGSVVINGGAAYTNNTTVSLTLSATDPSPASGLSSMRFSNNSQDWSDWVAYATSKSWTLLSGDGTKTVYAQYKDKAGNVSETVLDNIDLDSGTHKG